MSIATALKHMLAAGMPLDAIVGAVEQMERTLPLRTTSARHALLPRDWQQRRVRVFERDNYECRYCSRVCVDPHCDHVQPLSRGGSSEDDNLVTACPSCNLRKKDRTPAEWGVDLIGGHP